MSSVIRRLFCGLGITLAAAFASRLGAQSTAEYRTRLDALATAWRHVHTQRAHSDSVQRLALPSGTVRSGPLVVLTGPEDSAFTRRTIDIAARGLEQAFGAPVDQLLRTRLFAITRHGGQLGDSVADIAELNPRGKRVAQGGVFATEELVSAEWKHRGARLLASDLGPEFANWIRIGLPIDSATASTWVNVRIDLVVAPGLSARRCFAGEFTECALALGLTGDDDPAMRWYKPDERKQMVTEQFYLQLGRGRGGLFTRCASMSIASACDSLAHLIPPDRFSPRVGTDTRQSVVRAALAIGGTGAFERMLAAPRRVEDQLRAASGVSTDSLMRAWHAQVVAASPGTTTMSLATAATAFFWTCVCGALAMGSSRWR